MSNPSVVVITPSIGSPQLKQCVESVENQTYNNVRHLVVADGSLVYEKILFDLLEDEPYPNLEFDKLSRNVGANGWYGHRIFAAYSYLVDEDYVIFLDEDNWLSSEHVGYMVEAAQKGQWSYSLRNIYSESGKFICRDDCESLGKYPVFFDGNHNHIDTSCFCVPRNILVSGVSHSWYGKWGADRAFFATLRHYFPKGICTNKYSMNYRLGGNENSVKKEFFLRGNDIMKQRYPNGFPWNKD